MSAFSSEIQLVAFIEVESRTLPQRVVASDQPMPQMGEIIVYVVRYRILPSDVSPRQARHNINESVLRQLREAGIELAYPGRRIYEAKHAGMEVS